MGTTSKERVQWWLSILIPIIISLFAQAVLYGQFTAGTAARIKSLEDADAGIRTEMMPMEKRMEVFFPRKEAMAMQREITDIKTDVKEGRVEIREINSNVNLLLRQSTK